MQALQLSRLRIEQDLFFPRVRAAGNPYGSVRCVVGAQLKSARARLLGQREIEFEIAGDMGMRGRCAHGAKALRICRRLSCDDDALGEGVREETQEPAIAPH